MMDPATDSKPPYPECILPYPTYLDRIKEDGLHNGQASLMIQRRCLGEDMQITSEIFGNNLKGMSVNLLGGKFEPDHVCFTPNKPKMLPCEESFSGEYAFDGTLKGIYILIKDIHGQTFPSPRKFPNKEEYDKVEGAIRNPEMTQSPKDRLLAVNEWRKKEFNSKVEYEVSYKISVIHRPTNANYWHCQIEIAPDCKDGKTVNKDSAEWQKSALKALANFLVAYTSFNLPDSIPMVKQEWYLKEPA